MKYIQTLLKNLVHPAGIIGVVIALAIPFLIYLGPNVGAKDAIRILDLRMPLPLFLVQFGAGILLFCLLFKDFRTYFKENLPPKLYIGIVGVFAIAATLFAGTQIEARHRVQSDESVFMAIAQNMYFNQTTGTCDEGEFENGKLNCFRDSDSFKTKGLSFLYLLGMPFFGPDLHWIFHFELAMLFFAALLLFFAIRAWTSDDLLSALTSILLFAQPTVLFQFRSMSVEPLYIFLSALSLWIFKWAYDRNTLRHWILCALVLGFFAQTRQETVFCFLAFLVVALPKLLDKKDFKAPAFFATLSLFSAPILITISYFQGYGFQGGQYSAHGHFIENLKNNWDIMTKPLTESGLLSNPFLSSFNWLFLIGLVILVLLVIKDIYSKKFGINSKIAGFLLLYHIQTYMILENVSGDFSIEINQRYAVVMMPTMAFLAAFAVRKLLTIAYFLFGKSDLENNFKANVAMTVIFAVFICGNTVGYKDSFNKNIMYNRNHLTTEEAEIWKWLNTQPKKPRLFVYGRPWHFVAYGESAIHYNRARKIPQDSLQSLIKKYDGEVYYIRGLDCWDSKTYHAKAVEHRIPTTCDIFEREAKLEDVYQVLITHNYWVQIKKISTRRSYDPNRLLAFGFWQGDPQTQTFIFNSSEYFGSKTPWKVRFALNGDSIYAKPYKAGNYSDTLTGPMLKPGYNKLEADIYDSTTFESIAHVENYRFFRFDGALELSQVKPAAHRQAWGDLRTNASVDGHAFTINGKKLKEGFGIHASSETSFDLHGKFNRLTAIVGLDEESLCSDGIAYKVFGDGKILHENAHVSYGKPDTLDVSVQSVRNLSIVTDSLESKDCDHVDIIHPTLYPQGKVVLIPEAK
ncbi:MAG: NPCBM/NEW2 domain-containing protein [Fibrobacter sp.]|nr:NPCBM/NEW2 domain-containing protein [Fibrobacter sp.]